MVLRYVQNIPVVSLEAFESWLKALFYSEASESMVPKHRVFSAKTFLLSRHSEARDMATKTFVSSVFPQHCETANAFASSSRSSWVE